MLQSQKEKLERLLDFVTCVDHHCFYVSHADKGVVLGSYQVEINLNDPDERAFYDAMREMSYDNRKIT